VCFKRYWDVGRCLPTVEWCVLRRKKERKKERGQFLLDISAILHGIGMGVCFNENGTSKCTSGAKYICISVLRVTQRSYCHMRPVCKGSSEQHNWTDLEEGIFALKMYYDDTDV